MDDEKNNKEGISVKEIESYAKNYRYEIFFCALFVLATIFTFVFWGSTLSIFLTGIGGIVGVLLFSQIDKLQHQAAEAMMSKDKTVQLIFGLLGLIVAIFLAPLIFLVTGIHAGKSMAKLFKSQNPHVES